MSGSITEKHVLMDGKLHVYRRENSRYWQCSTYMAGRNHRVTTKEENVVLAKEYARYWYMERCVEARRGRLGFADAVIDADAPPPNWNPHARRPRRATGPTFKDAADKFLAEYGIITQGQRNENYANSHALRIRTHLMPFFGDKTLAEINAGLVQDYRAKRMTKPADFDEQERARFARPGNRKTKIQTWKPPARSTLHHDTVTLRLILKTAQRHGWIAQVPDISPPYKTSGKVGHRAWFSKDEYEALYRATGERAKNPLNERWRGVCEDLHDFVLFMVNTGLRPDEAARLQCRDVEEIQDEATGKRILKISVVLGKRGRGLCMSMPGAVLPFRRMVKRHKPKPEDLVFEKSPRELLNTVLVDLKLKHDRNGNVRTAYSLRHTYICFRLLEGADIYQVAKNCRTSVEMIEKHYAVHLVNALDTAAINVVKPRSAPASGTKENEAKRKAGPASGSAKKQAEGRTAQASGSVRNQMKRQRGPASGPQRKGLLKKT